MKVTLKEKLNRLRATHTYRVEKAKLEFVSGINRLMKRSGVTNAELARRLDSSPAYATKVMRGDSNFTVDSMVKIAHALGGSLHVHVADKEHEVRWHEVITCKERTARSPQPSKEQLRTVLSDNDDAVWKNWHGTIPESSHEKRNNYA